MSASTDSRSSFNSSGATIMPEVVSRTDSRTHGSRSGSGSGSGFGGNSIRMLSSQDSVSREFDAALGAGDDGMIRLLQGQSNSGQWDFKSDFVSDQGVGGCVKRGLDEDKWWRIRDETGGSIRRQVGGGCEW